jgi:hypothetical protein
MVDGCQRWPSVAAVAPRAVRHDDQPGRPVAVDFRKVRARPEPLRGVGRRVLVRVQHSDMRTCRR